jgi:hypothetical protein
MQRKHLEWAAAIGTTLFGLSAAWYDVSTTNDDAAKLMLAAALATGGAAGFAAPGKSWRWGVLFAVWTPLFHAARLFAGAEVRARPPGWTTIVVVGLLLAAIGIAGASIGAWLRVRSKGGSAVFA